ncbi:DoxX family protein [Shinella zoogloeoides]|nr:DoxX family protein [Shinella zoogloeoides]UEX81849.1 DoxX family protein [Shinella zoogloeoides]
MPTQTPKPQELSMQHILVLAGRILLALMFITAGYPKLLDPSGTAGMISGAGLPAATLLAYLAGLFELVAGLFILVGFRTKITALLLAAFCVFTALVFHSGSINIPDFPEGANGLLTVFNGLMMWKNITIAGGFLVLAAFGPGALSIDGRRAAA